MLTAQSCASCLLLSLHSLQLMYMDLMVQSTGEGGKEPPAPMPSRQAEMKQPLEALSSLASLLWGYTTLRGARQGRPQSSHRHKR